MRLCVHFTGAVNFSEPAQRLHRHGWYQRYADCHSARRSRIARFRCPRCGRTFSVLPAAQILSGTPSTLNRARSLEADPTQRWGFLAGGSGGRLPGV
jgi:hypothetical protein